MKFELAILLILFNLVRCETDRYYLPTVFWTQYNPIFSCNPSVINVRFGDHIHFHCPVPGSKSYFPDGAISESMLFVKSKEEFLNYNVKDGARYLYCRKNITEGKCDSKGYNCPKVYNMIFTEAFTPYDINFEKGKDYYLIGKRETLVRDNDTTNQPTYDISNTYRLKIHVCDDKDISNGLCERAFTTSFYYKDCQKRCSNLTKKGDTYYRTPKGECYQQFERTCVSPLINYTSKEQTHVKTSCPPINCSDWKIVDDSLISSTKTCFKMTERYCYAEKSGYTRRETRPIAVQCPKTNCTSWVLDPLKIYKESGKCYETYFRKCRLSHMNITFTERRLEFSSCASNETLLEIEKLSDLNNSDESILKYVAISASIASLLFGILCGGMTKKTLISRQIKKASNDNADENIVIGNTALFDTLRKNSSMTEPAVLLVNTIDRRSHPNVGRSMSLTPLNETANPQFTLATLPRTKPESKKVSRMPSSNSQVLLLRPISLSSLGSVTALNEYRRRSMSDALSSEYQPSSLSSSVRSDVFIEETLEDV